LSTRAVEDRLCRTVVLNGSGAIEVNVFRSNWGHIALQWAILGRMKEFDLALLLILLTMRDEQQSWTLDNSTSASQPGGIRVEFFRWFQSYPKWPSIWGGMLFLSLVLAIAYSKFFWVAFLVALIINVFYWQRVRDHFLHGCVNPAVIVSVEPMLIAAATDLSTGQGTYPAIRIFESSLSSVCGQEPKIGTRLATVALYSSGTNEHAPKWDSFDPRPVDCATTDQTVMSHTMNAIDQESWQQLQSWLAYIPRPFQPGLYNIENSEEHDSL
jgi:hypothetical protein